MLHKLFQKSVDTKPGATPKGVDYEGFWNLYAKNWKPLQGDHKHIGDEWAGVNAGAATNLEEYSKLIEASFIAPHITAEDSVIELGIGGGKTAEMLLKHCKDLTCVDIAQEMIDATAERLGDAPVKFIKIDGISLAAIPDSSADVFFSYDAMVHIEPRDIFNYLTQVPRLLKGRRLCIFHHTNVLSDYGWKKFLNEWQANLMGQRSGGAFSVMTDTIMEKFLDHLGYEVISKDTTTVPRDCVWVCTAPEEVKL